VGVYIFEIRKRLIQTAFGMNQQFKNDKRKKETIFHVIPDELIEEARLDTGSYLKINTNHRHDDPSGSFTHGCSSSLSSGNAVAETIIFDVTPEQYQLPILIIASPTKISLPELVSDARNPSG